MIKATEKEIAADYSNESSDESGVDRTTKAAIASPINFQIRDA